MEVERLPVFDFSNFYCSQYTFFLIGNRKLELRGWIQLWQYKQDLFYRSLLMSVMMTSCRQVLILKVIWVSIPKENNFEVYLMLSGRRKNDLNVEDSICNTLVKMLPFEWLVIDHTLVFYWLSNVFACKMKL